MEIKEFKKIEQIKEIWEDFYSNNKMTIPNMEYNFVRKWNNQIKQKLGNAKRFFIIYSDNVPQIIIPLDKVKNGYHSQYLLDYYDVLCSPKLSFVEIKNYLKEFISRLNCKVEFTHVNQDSILYNTLKDDEDYLISQTDCCVKIPIRQDINGENGYEVYFNNLSKSSRQNLRTSYNRLNTDNKKFSLEVVKGKISKHDYKIFNKLYIQRRAERYKNLSGLKKILYSCSEPILNSLSGAKEVISYILKIDNKVASYVVALKRKNSIIVPRLVINEEFKKYSVGNMIVNEIMKRLIEENSYDYFDLALGSENYKFVMGGIEHFNYSIVNKK